MYLVFRFEEQNSLEVTQPLDLIPEFLRTKYDSVEFIGEGAEGHVYKCVSAGLTTAVKILGELDPVSRARFKREVDIIRRVDHKNVVRVLDAGETDGHHWFESEYANQGHFGVMHSYLFYSDLDRVKYFAQICSGVQALHDLNPPIIHRDLKPRNILVFEQSEPERHIVLKIADFGTAAIAGESSSLTTTGAALGTGLYMAPERVRNPRIKTPESDIYSLGITFLEACTGHTTPNQENLNAVPELLRPIIAKMVRQHPNDRYPSVGKILEELGSFSVFRLLYGREPQHNEVSTPIFHVNIGREVENALDALHRCTPDNVLDLLAVLERTLDRLGDARDHEAHAIINIPRSALVKIEKADNDALLRLVQRFDYAAEKTGAHDFFSAEPDMWARFLSETFHLSEYRPTKHLCLEALVRHVYRFGTPWTKEYLYRTIVSIEDPSHMEHLAEYFREVDREDIAGLLDGVPDQRFLDLAALRLLCAARIRQR